MPASSSGTRSQSMPNCCGPPPRRMPAPRTAKSGLTRTATRARMPSVRLAAPTRASSPSDSSSISAPAAIAWLSSPSRLPGPAKLTAEAGIGVSSACRSSAPEATSKPSTRPLKCCSTAGIGLALTA